eukprot:scaffold830_cov377-Prasinococcus_capsulatus_cf.AAC.14
MPLASSSKPAGFSPCALPRHAWLARTQRMPWPRSLADVPGAWLLPPEAWPQVQPHRAPPSAAAVRPHDEHAQTQPLPWRPAAVQGTPRGCAAPGPASC